MRHALVPLILLASAAAVGAEKPIPQDSAQIEKRRHDRLEWNRRMLEGAYDKVGKKDPRWDEPAHKVLDLAARMFSNECDPIVTQGDLYAPAKAAVDAGCDDPLIRYFYVRSHVGSNYPGADEAVRRGKEVDKALADSRYPAVRRVGALSSGGLNLLSLRKPSEEDKKEAERHFDAALALLEESVKSDERNEFWEDRWFHSLMDLIRGYRQTGMAAEAAYERVDNSLAKVPEVKVLRLLVRGEFYEGYGWEARTGALAVNVPQGGFEKLEQRHAIARKAYEEAWQLRPGTTLAATGMLGIERAIGGDRANMELWFDRAIKADGDNRQACWTKLEWLDPKWYGNLDDMLAFGRACGATRNWRAGITLLLADAHWRYASHQEPKEEIAYLKSPAVWADIQSVYDEYLKHYPNDAIARSKFATFAYLTEHYPEAHAQYEAVGERLAQWSDSSFFPLHELKRNRSFTARVVAGEFALKKGWHRLVLKNNEAKWRVDTPVEMARRQEAGILGARARNVWSCTAAGVTYTVRVQPIPPAMRTEKPEAILEAARAAVAKERGGAARDAHATELAEHPELPAEGYLIDVPDLKPKLIRVQAAVIGNRLYEFSVTASEADVSGKAASAFLNSFKLQE